MVLRATLRWQRQIHLQRAVQSRWLAHSLGNGSRMFATKQAQAFEVQQQAASEEDKDDMTSARGIPLRTDDAMQTVATATLAELNREQHVNKWFPFSKATQKKHFAERLNKRVDETFDMIHYRHIMLREKTLDILSLMQNWATTKNNSKVCLINGERGSGKSFALLQTVQFARENGWIAMYIPRARSWVTDAPYVIPSKYMPGKFDIDVLGMELLKNLLHAHQDQLGQLKVRGKYGARYYPAKLGARPKDPKSYDPSTLTLLDMVQNGLQDEELACAAVCDLRQELAQVTEFPVLIAIDEYNCWFRDTVFAYENVDVQPEDISLISALRSVTLDGHVADHHQRLQNGLLVVATSENYPSKQRVPRFQDEIHLTTYSPPELQAVAKYYEETDLLYVLGKKTLTPRELAYLRLQTKALPLHVFEYASTS